MSFCKKQSLQCLIISTIFSVFGSQSAFSSCLRAATNLVALSAEQQSVAAKLYEEILPEIEKFAERHLSSSQGGWNSDAVTIDDLYSEAHFQIIKAVQNYDPAMGMSLKNYTVNYYINLKLLNFIETGDRMTAEQVRKVELFIRAANKITDRDGGQPSTLEVLDALTEEFKLRFERENGALPNESQIENFKLEIREAVYKADLIDFENPTKSVPIYATALPEHRLILLEELNILTADLTKDFGLVLGGQDVSQLDTKTVRDLKRLLVAKLHCLGMRQWEIANALHLSRPYVTNILADVRETYPVLPSPETASAVWHYRGEPSVQRTLLNLSSQEEAFRQYLLRRHEKRQPSFPRFSQSSQG